MVLQKLLYFLTFAVLCHSTSATIHVANSFSCSQYGHCFEDYLRNASLHSTSDLEFVLLEGDHFITTPLVLNNVHNFTVIGVLTWVSLDIFSNSSITFVNSHNITFFNLHVYYDGTEENSSALLFDNTTLVSIRNARLHVSKSNSNIRRHSRALSIHQSTASISDCLFYGGCSVYGGAIYIDQSIVRFSGENSFTGNTAYVSGGAIFANKSRIVFDGNDTFSNNSAITDEVFVTGGDALYVLSTEVHFNGVVKFRENGPIRDYLIGAAVLVLNLSSIRVEGRAIFARNYGGAMTIFRSELNTTGETNFTDNVRNGGSYGAGLYAEHSNISFSGVTNFIRNNVTGGVGGALFAFRSVLELTGSVVFESNRAETGGAMYIDSSQLSQRDGTVSYISNNGHSKGGAVLITNSTMTVSGLSEYIENKAMKGGAMGLEVNSKIALQAPVTINFLRNRADFGGGIFISDLNAIAQCQNITLHSECFFKIQATNSSDIVSDIHLNFTDNSADEAGTILHGGSLQLCRVHVDNEEVETNAFDFFRSILTSFPSGDNSSISSDPLRVCFCDDVDIVNCSKRQSAILLRRGERFTFRVIAVGQFNYPVPSELRASYLSRNPLSSDIYYENIMSGTQCTSANVRAFASESESERRVVVYPERPCGNIANTRVTINVTFEDCPPGFDLRNNTCTCEERFLNLTGQSESSCDIDRGLIRRPNSTTWIQPIWDNDTYMGFAFSSQCQPTYCKQENSSLPTLLDFSDLNSDIQCHENRAGTMCGRCKTDHSLTLKNFTCKKCTNKFITLLLFFAFAGIALIAFLLVLHITVAAGTINGLLLYANVVNICRDLFFPPHKTKQFNPLTVFIAWINLDFGISSCFYDGLDYYAYCWLQFVFPLYLWFLIGVIILACRFSTRVGRLFGSNPIAVLATVILMSYTKLLQTSVDSLTYTTLLFPNGTEQKVWFPDPNVRFFFEGKHTILSIFSILVIAFLLLPYIFLLTFGYRLQALSGKRCFKWINNLKPVLDAYYAPYNKNSRYWPGFLLLIRAILFLSLSVIQTNFTLTAVSSLFTAIAIIPWLSKCIYEKVYLDIIEASFIFNISVLTSASYYVQSVNKSQLMVSNISVGIAFAEFVGIIIYHICRRLKIVECFRRCKKVTLKKPTADKMVDSEKIATVTVVELREPLLESL